MMQSSLSNMERWQTWLGGRSRYACPGSGSYRLWVRQQDGQDVGMCMDTVEQVRSRRSSSKESRVGEQGHKQ